ncbi:MAG: hypothetical protein KF745_14790 [Phycisphaeraceae bacterium]|nr:hypothetical protein [Phycisphaeraceae bacterium]
MNSEQQAAPPALLLASVVLLACGSAISQARAEPPRYTVEVLGSLAEAPQGTPASLPGALAGAETVVGRSMTPDGSWQAFAWSRGTMRALEGFPGYGSSSASGVNSRGTIVGALSTADGGSPRPAVWTEGGLSILPTLGGPFGAAAAINESGHIAGWSAAGATVWVGGVPVVLPNPDGFGQSFALSISDAGDVAGHSMRQTGGSCPVLWTGQIAAELPTPPGSVGQANAVNNLAEVVGSIIDAQYDNRAVLWRAGQFLDLGTLGGPLPWAFAADINDRSQIVGASDSPLGFTGFLWEDGEMYDLRRFLAPGYDYEITTANAITDDGVIAATASIDGRQTAVLLRPVPAPGAMAVLALCSAPLVLRRARPALR